MANCNKNIAKITIRLPNGKIRQFKQKYCPARDTASILTNNVQVFFPGAKVLKIDMPGYIEK